MKQELVDALKIKYPKLFAHAGGNFVSVGNGWHSIFAQLCNDLATVSQDKLTLFRVKEKFGGLSVQLDFDADVDKETQRLAWGLLNKAELDSLRVCEFCGEDGKRSDVGFWIKTICPACFAKDRNDR